MRDVLGVELADLTPTAVGQALCARGVNITGDVDYGPGQIRRIDTSGESGYKLPGLQRVSYAFDDGRLTSIYLFRQATSQTATLFEERFRYLSGEFPLEKRDGTFASFRALDMQVRMQVSLSLYSGQVSEFYQGLMISGETLPVAASPKVTCPYPTMDDAARAGLEDAWKLQENSRREVAGYIYQPAAGKFVPALSSCLEKGTLESSITCIPPEVRELVVAFYHTHPDTNHPLNLYLDNVGGRQFFSVDDIVAAITLQTTMYIRSTFGIRKFDGEGQVLSYYEQHPWFPEKPPGERWPAADWDRGEMIPLETQ